MYQTDLPSWPDAETVLAKDGFTVSPEHLRKLGDGDIQKGVRQLRLMLAAETERKLLWPVVLRPPHVRLAGPDDEPAILELLLADVAENAAHVAPPSEERILTHIQLGTRKRGGFTAVIDGEDGKPIAVAILNATQWWWSDDWYLGDIVTYVHPDHRKGRCIDNLLEFERWLAQEMSDQYGKQTYLVCGVMGTRRYREKLMLFWRRFFEVGRAYMWPAPGEKP